MQLVGGMNAAYDEAQAAARGRIEAEDNKQLALSAAADAIARGGREAQATRMAGTQLAAQQRVAYGASGVDASSGTAAQLQGQTGYFTELDARTAENNAAAEAWGFKRHGLKYQQQAQLDAARSSSKQSSYILGGVGGAISGASRYFSSDD